VSVLQGDGRRGRGRRLHGRQPRQQHAARHARLHQPDTRSVGDACDVYVQHHNDLGVATANAIAAAEQGANWIDASVIGIGDRGGCVALEEAAALFEMYGVQTGIRLEGLYELCRYVQQAYGIALPPWKPIVGSNWNKEEGAGHLEGSDNAEATIGIAPQVIGREFEAVIGGKILFGRERQQRLYR
jgi:isopropylmalate/homocitrate/citramalate synthase